MFILYLFKEKEKKTLVYWFSCYNLSHCKCYKSLQILSNTILNFLNLNHAKFGFLNGFRGYNQIVINSEDQEKTTFTCPFGTYALGKCFLVCVMHQ